MGYRKGIARTALLAATGFAALSISLSPSHAATLNVDNGNVACNDGTGTPFCTIGAAVAAAVAGDTVSVAPGTYTENVLVNKNLILVSTGGRAVTTITGISSVGALGAVQVTNNTTGVQIGGAGQGFTVNGIDNGNPAIENAAIYFQGSHSNAQILDNLIVAAGDHGLLTEFGATISGFVIDGNEFAGSTFFSPPAGFGFSMQFSLANVPRQLVVMGGGGGGGNTSNITFINNQITGTAGGFNVSGQPQGNTLVTLDSNGATISGNTFAGTTSRFATSLRTRGPNTTTFGNSFSGAGLLPTATCHIFVQETGEDLATVAGANSFDTLPILFPANDATTGSICPGPAPDHYVLYDVKRDRNGPDFVEQTVTLADQFDEDGTSRSFEVTKVKKLGNPADKNGEGINAAEIHLVAYRIKRASGTPKHKTVRGIKVTNQFGELLVDARQPKLLLVPSAKSLDGPVDPLPLSPVEYFKCYDARESSGAPKFEKRVVTIADQFDAEGETRSVEVRGPAFLCNPVDKNDEGLISRDDHLMCYDIRPVAAGGDDDDDDDGGSSSRFRVDDVHINNQFGPLILDTRSIEELCVPSEKEIVGVVPGGDDDDDDD